MKSHVVFYAPHEDRVLMYYYKNNEPWCWYTLRNSPEKSSEHQSSKIGPISFEIIKSSNEWKDIELIEEY